MSGTERYFKFKHKLREKIFRKFQTVEKLMNKLKTAREKVEQFQMWGKCATLKVKEISPQ